MAHQAQPTSDLEVTIDRRILAFREARHCMMFSDLAEALPDYTWQRLFRSLSRLSKARLIDLVAYQWDSEIIFLQGDVASHLPPQPERQP